jgi:RNA polymerase sigma-70 factor (ECF subfamily)
MEDSELIARVAGGDEGAFELLVKKYQRPVLGTVYRYLGNSPAAEDIAQEVFIKVWHHARGFKGKSAFSTWLYRIVVNQCLNFRNERKRKQTVPLDESIADDCPGVDAKYDRKRKAEIVRDAVNELPGRQRMALILSRFEDYSYEEIARIMGVSLSSVESLIFRAKDGLKKKLLSLKMEGAV